MNLDQLIALAKVPTKTYHEDAMVKFLMAHFVADPRVRCWTDRHKNVFVVKGAGERLPCVSAHIDSVQPLRENVQVHVDGDVMTASYKEQQVGFGADDKAGVHVALEIIARNENIAGAFFATEELGCQGSGHAHPGFFREIGYLIEFDCPGRGMLSYTAGGYRLFENDGEFIKRALPALYEGGTTYWQHHPYTDVMAIRRRFPLSCMNLSAGYYNWHASNEYIRLSDVEAAIEQGDLLVHALGANLYHCPMDLRESEQASPVAVTSLFMPPQSSS